jgi:hypothetical protein
VAGNPLPGERRHIRRALVARLRTEGSGNIADARGVYEDGTGFSARQQVPIHDAGTRAATFTKVAVATLAVCDDSDLDVYTKCLTPGLRQQSGPRPG